MGPCQGSVLCPWCTFNSRRGPHFSRAPRSSDPGAHLSQAPVGQGPRAASWATPRRAGPGPGGGASGGGPGAGPLVPPLALRAAGAGPAGGAAASPKARGGRGPAGCVGQMLRAHRHDIHWCVCTRLCAHVSRVPAPPLHTCTHGSRPAPRRATLVPCSAESRAQAVRRSSSPSCPPPGRPPPPAARGPGVFPHLAFSRPQLRFSLLGALSVCSPLSNLQMRSPKEAPQTWSGPLYLAPRWAGRSRVGRGRG